jgi:hypothetical protein
MVRNDAPMLDWQGSGNGGQESARKNTDLAARTVLAARSPVPAVCDVWVDAPRWAALNEEGLTSPAFEAALPWTLKVLAGRQ